MVTDVKRLFDLLFHWCFPDLAGISTMMRWLHKYQRMKGQMNADWRLECMVERTWPDHQTTGKVTGSGIVKAWIGGQINTPSLPVHNQHTHKDAAAFVYVQFHRTHTFLATHQAQYVHVFIFIYIYWEIIKLFQN